MADDPKKCSKCGDRKSLIAFGKDRSTIDGYSRWCRSCRGKSNRNWQKKNPEYIKDYMRKWEKEHPDYRYGNSLRHNFGITIDDYNRMFAEQKGRCAICDKHQSEFKRRLNVDHNRETGKIRELLCRNCNIALGLFFHDPNFMGKAITYLKRHK